jgi:hypothetical protein
MMNRTVKNLRMVVLSPECEIAPGLLESGAKAWTSFDVKIRRGCECKFIDVLGAAITILNRMDAASAL